MNGLKEEEEAVGRDATCMGEVVGDTVVGCASRYELGRGASVVKEES